MISEETRIGVKRRGTIVSRPVEPEELMKSLYGLSENIDRHYETGSGGGGTSTTKKSWEGVNDLNPETRLLRNSLSERDQFTRFHRKGGC